MIALLRHEESIKSHGGCDCVETEGERGFDLKGLLGRCGRTAASESKREGRSDVRQRLVSERKMHPGKLDNLIKTK